MIKYIFTFLLSISIQGHSMTIDNVNDIRADWRINSDQVMGGVSEVYFDQLDDNGLSYYRLSGDVRTANNGGFIQALMLINNNFDAYKGIKIKVRGNGEKYFIWIRTPAARFPWDRYSYEFYATNDWKEIEIPFSDLTKTAFYMPRSLNKSKIRTIAVAAYGKDMLAQVDIANIELF